MRSLRKIAWIIAAMGFGLHLLGQAGAPFLAFPEAWMMMALATLTSVLGYRWVAPLVAGAGLLDALLGARLLLELVALYTIAALLAAWFGDRLRRAYAERKRSSRLISLLVRGQKELYGLNTPGAVLEALPAILEGYGQGHVSVWEPEAEGGGFRRVAASQSFPQDCQVIGAEGVVGRAFREGRPIYLPDVRLDPQYLPATAPNPQPPSARHSPPEGDRPHGARHSRPEGDRPLCELALPLFEQGEAIAVLNLEYPQPLSEESLQALMHFAQGVSRHLDHLSEGRALALLEELNRAMHSAQDLEGLGERALALLGQVLEVESGSLARQEGSRLRALAFWGDVRPEERALLEEGIPYGQGLAWEVLRTAQPLFSEHYASEARALSVLKGSGLQSLLLHPIALPGVQRVRFLLGFQTRRPRRWRQSEKALLARACRVVGLALEGMLERQRVKTLLSLQHSLLELSPEAAYGQILQTAVAMVPGAEAGSLILWQDGAFEYRAAQGYDLEGLRGVRFSLEQQQAWHGDPLGWRQGLPRIRSSGLVEASLESGLPEDKKPQARLEEIKANLHLPIRYAEEVLALLNLDNLHDPQAFDQDSLQAAQLFAPAVATLLHELRHRQRLEEAALSDVLTGLPNRRAFDLRLAEELERARRYAYPLSLLVMDLSGFKAINDRLGHKEGDRALQAVASALKKQRRNGDSLYRWGGDEFAAILPHAALEGAIAAATRYHRAIGTLEIGGMRLGVNIGAACFPKEAQDAEALLHLADERMYQAKSRKLPFAMD